MRLEVQIAEKRAAQVTIELDADDEHEFRMAASETERQLLVAPLALAEANETGLFVGEVVVVYAELPEGQSESAIDSEWYRAAHG